jgi:hypothetical protein
MNLGLTMAKLEQVHEVRDDLTGEITSRVSNVYEINKLPKEPDYIKLYVEDIGLLHGLTPAAREVLLYVAAASGYDGVASLTARRKASIALTIGVTIGVVSNALTACIKANLLKRVGHGEYEPNPFVFARGEWAKIRERREKFVASFVYGPNGRQILEARKLHKDEADRCELEARGQARLDA